MHKKSFPYRIASGLLLALAATSAPAQFLSELDPNWREAEVQMPPAPQEKSLREFHVSSAVPHRYLIDESSLEVGADYVVRYVLVIRTAGGAEQVSYEGIRCPAGEWKLYAHWRPSEGWVPPRRSEWQAIASTRRHTPQAALAKNYFCDGPAPPRTTADARRGLRYGSERWNP